MSGFSIVSVIALVVSLGTLAWQITRDRWERPVVSVGGTKGSYQDFQTREPQWRYRLDVTNVGERAVTLIEAGLITNLGGAREDYVTVGLAEEKIAEFPIRLEPHDARTMDNGGRPCAEKNRLASIEPWIRIVQRRHGVSVQARYSASEPSCAAFSDRGGLNWMALPVRTKSKAAAARREARTALDEQSSNPTWCASRYGFNMTSRRTSKSAPGPDWYPDPSRPVNSGFWMVQHGRRTSSRYLLSQRLLSPDRAYSGFVSRNVVQSRAEETGGWTDRFGMLGVLLLCGSTFFSRIVTVRTPAHDGSFVVAGADRLSRVPPCYADLYGLDVSWSQPLHEPRLRRASPALTMTPSVTVTFPRNHGKVPKEPTPSSG